MSFKGIRNTYSKTECKYTKLFFTYKCFCKIIFNSFSYLCTAKLNITVMYNKNIKLILAALIVITAIWQFTDKNIGNGIALLLLAGMFILLYFKNEIIIMAFFKLRKQDFDGAKKLLDKIKNPEAALVRKQQGYYNYLNGLMLSQTNLTLAEKHLKKAVELGLNMDQDMAMAKLNLAGIALTKRRKMEAIQLLNEAKKLDKHNMLKDQITMMKQQLKKI